MAFRPFATAVRKSLRIGLIPADGIGREVIPVSVKLSNVHFDQFERDAFTLLLGRTQNIGSFGI